MKLNIKHWTIITLVLLGLVNGYRAGYANVALQTIAAVATACLTNLALDYYKKKKPVIPESAIITGLIIAMVAAPSTTITHIIPLAFIAIVSKFLIQYNKRTIFNPAALSLLFGVLVFNLQLGWWGDFNHILTIIAGALLLIEYRGQWKTVYSFMFTLTTLIIIHSIIFNISIVEELNFKIGTCFFFAFFMLTDPKTKPFMADKSIPFGIITAIFSFLSILFFPSTTLIGGLLVANLATPFLNVLSLRKIRVITAKNN